MATVTVLGPNLPGKLQDQGDFHVHAAGCAHLNKSPLRQIKWERYEMNAASETDVIVWIYEDIIAERLREDVDTTFEQEIVDLACTVHFAPCVKLPWKETT